jgi:uncharacterized Zn finger protein
MSSKRPGRPKGSINVRDIVEVEASRCKKCGSSRRTKYENAVRRDYAGNGLEFIAIIYRTCRCEDCGQARRDQEKVYAPKGNAEGESITLSTRPRLEPKSRTETFRISD